MNRQDSIDCIVGCNVRGRLVHIQNLLEREPHLSSTAPQAEVEDLLRFFPEHKTEIRKNKKGLRIHVCSSHYRIPLSLKQFRVIDDGGRNDKALMKMLNDMRAFDVEYNRHFGPYLFFSTKGKTRAKAILAAVRRFLNERGA